MSDGIVAWSASTQASVCVYSRARVESIHCDREIATYTGGGGGVGAQIELLGGALALMRATGRQPNEGRGLLAHSVQYSQKKKL